MIKTDDQCEGCIDFDGEKCTITIEIFGMRMAETGTCYQASPKVAIAVRLARLAVEMDDIATEMGYYGGLTHWAARAKEMRGAAAIAVDWSKCILSEG